MNNEEKDLDFGFANETNKANKAKTEQKEKENNIILNDDEYTVGPEELDDSLKKKNNILDDSVEFVTTGKNNFKNYKHIKLKAALFTMLVLSGAIAANIYSEKLIKKFGPSVNDFLEKHSTKTEETMPVTENNPIIVDTSKNSK